MMNEEVPTTEAEAHEDVVEVDVVVEEDDDYDEGELDPGDTYVEGLTEQWLEASNETPA